MVNVGHFLLNVPYDAYDETSQDRQCLYNVTLKHVCVITVAMQKQ
jgi:hypothetical protein